MANFEDLKISKSILKALREAAIDTPTEIQERAIPRIRSGADVIGVAQTGTGKTLAYLLPILTSLRKAEVNGPRALVLVPTRELALQVKDACDSVTLYSNIRSIAIYGGIGITKQLDELKESDGTDIVIATPGRLWDIYRSGALPLKFIKFLVFDEADRMLDMGFVPQIRRLLEVVQVKRQNLLFSATFLGRVEEMSEEFLAFPERVEVTPSATPSVQVKQLLYEVPNLRTKLNFLEILFSDSELGRVIVFCRTKENAESVFNFIDRKVDGIVRVIHSNKGQTSRINAINAFKRGEVRVLVSTDVSARGIDVSKVTHVINFDVPVIYEDYVHRIGRTGRVKETGTAISFVTPIDKYYIKKIEEVINMELPIEAKPENVAIGDFIPGEERKMAIETDMQRKKEDPNYQGAFHEKKKKSEKNKKRKLGRRR